MGSQLFCSVVSITLGLDERIRHVCPMLLSRAAYLGAFSNERCFCLPLKSYIGATRFSGFTLLLFLLFSAFYVWQIINFLSSIRRLVDMYNFYTYLLKIPDVCDATFLSPAPVLSLAQADIQTIAWSEVVRRIEAIREENPTTAISSKSARNSNSSTTAKLDAHDIANRIMRQENYLIALFNKELLDLSSPLPSFLSRFSPLEQGKGKTLTRALEWNLRFCLMEYLFDRQGRVRKVFLQAKNRTVLIEG